MIELTAHKADVYIPVYGSIADAEVYLKSEADKVIAELKQKLHDAEMAKDDAEAANTEYRIENEKLKAENKRLIDCVKNALDVLNAVGPLVLEHDKTCILTQGVASAVNWCKRLIDEQTCRANAEEEK